MAELEELYQEIQKKISDKDFSFKNDLIKSGWFRYFFKERSKIARWGRNTGLIRAKFFSVKLERAFKKRLRDFYNLIIVPIIPFCKVLCEQGWKWKTISIKEYNLIVYLYDFCKKLGELDKKSLLDLKKFALVEKAFFKLALNTDYPLIILRTAEKLTASYGDQLQWTDSQKSNLLLSLENLFNYQMMPISFYKFSQSYNMYLFKTYFEWKDIIIDTKAQMVNKVFYNCSYETFSEIITYAKTMMMLIRNLEQEREQTCWLEELVARKELTAAGQIAEFFSSMGYKYDEYREDFFLFTITFLGGLIKQLESFIGDKWTMIDFKERELEDKLVFDSQIETRFKTITEEYSRVKSKVSATVIVKIEISDFFAAQDFFQLLPDEAHLSVYKSIQHIMSELLELGVLLHTVYETKEAGSVESEFLLYMVESPRKWQGKSVAGVYQFYYELLITMAHYFKEEKLTGRIKGLASLNSKIKSHKTALRSVLDTTSFLESRLSIEDDKTRDASPAGSEELEDSMADFPDS